MLISSRRVALRQYGASRSISVIRDCRRASRVTEVYTEPPSRSPNQPLRVYSNPFCPFAQRVRLIVAAKRIPHEAVYVHLDRKPAWFLNLNKNGQVPVLDHDGKIVRESLICFDYLDEVFGETRLWPLDSFKKASQSILLSDFSNKFLGSWYRYRGGDTSPHLLPAMSEVIADIQCMIDTSGGRYVNGADCGAVDLLLWPFFERLIPAADVRPGESGKTCMVLGKKFDGDLRRWSKTPNINTDFSEQRFPVLHRWMKVMMEKEEAVQSTALPFDVHVKLTKSLTERTPIDYSLADTNGDSVIVYAASPN